MKIKLQLSLGFFLFFLSLSSNEGICQTLTYDINAEEDAYVIFQLKEETTIPDSIRNQLIIQNLGNQIKSVNSKPEYAQFARKVASFSLENNGKSTTYLVIRNFDDLESAGLYAQDIKKEMDKAIYGQIGEPFPISHSNYKRCIAEKDFGSYYRFYNNSRR